MQSIHPDHARNRHFDELTREQREDAIKRMAAEGWTDHGIAAATRLSIEMVRQVLARRDHERR